MVTSPADRATQRKIIHCDCDCFYAAVEVRDRPELAGRPVAVGGSAEGRGVIATCNYEARRFGVHSAMPAAHAQRLCPDLILIRPDMDKYREVSRAIHRIFQRFTDRIEPLSLDEAFLDLTGSELLAGSATRIAMTIRNAVRREIGITISAGVAPNKFLAKIASDWNKPDGLFVIAPDDVAAFLPKLPVQRLPGVGPATTRRLTDLGIRYCADLLDADTLALHEQLGSQAQRLLQLARGEDTRPVRPRSVRKSVSVEHTYDVDLIDLNACRRALADLEPRLRARLTRAGATQGISRCFVKVRFSDFTTTTAERAVEPPQLETLNEVLAEAFTELLETAWLRGRKPVRLLGVGVGFRNQEAPRQQLVLPLQAPEIPGSAGEEGSPDA